MLKSQKSPSFYVSLPRPPALPLLALPHLKDARYIAVAKWDIISHIFTLPDHRCFETLLMATSDLNAITQHI